LRRRLAGRSGGEATTTSVVSWLQTMVARPGPKESKAPLERLLTLIRENRRGHLRDAALAVEDAWQAQTKQRLY
jgi:hypothetical protein